MAAETPTIELRSRSKRQQPSIRADLRAVDRHRSLIRYLFLGTIRTENTGTLFGFAWWILDPLLMMAVFWFVFGVIFKRPEVAFPIFILISLISWEFFVTSATTSMAVSLSTERSMQTVAFPRSVIPFSLTLAEAAHFAVGLALSAAGAWVFYGFSPRPEWLLVIPLALLQVVFTLGVAFFLAALNFFFRDVSHLMSYVFRVWYFLSPGIYSITRIPDRYLTLYYLNPFATFFSGYHAAILEQPTPPVWAIVYTAIVSVVALVGGYSFFVVKSPGFVKLA